MRNEELQVRTSRITAEPDWHWQACGERHECEKIRKHNSLRGLTSAKNLGNACTNGEKEDYHHRIRWIMPDPGERVSEQILQKRHIIGIVSGLACLLKSQHLLHVSGFIKISNENLPCHLPCRDYRPHQNFLRLPLSVEQLVL